MDLIGKRFTKLVVLSKIGVRNRMIYWLCQCDCGNTTEQPTGYLNAKRARRCGHCTIRGSSKGRGRRNVTPYNKIPNDKLFIKGRKYAPCIKERIIQEKLLTYACECGNIGEWRGAELVLQLDHIDGDRTNNQLSNFRFLCPNCHTQKVTWGRKRFRKLPSDDELIKLARKYSNRQIANMFDCHQSSVSHRLRKYYQ